MPDGKNAPPQVNGRGFRRCPGSARDWDAGNLLVDMSKRGKIAYIAGDGRQQAVKWEIPDKNSTTTELPLQFLPVVSSNVVRYIIGLRKTAKETEK